MSDLNTARDPIGTRRLATDIEDASGRASAVSWAASFAGAAALSLLLLILGTGLAAVSPHSVSQRSRG